MKRLTMLAGLDAVGGYGRTAINFARGIKSLTGARVQIRASSISERFGATIPDDIRERIVQGPQSDPWELLIHPPNFVPTPGKRTAWYTMNESTRLQPLSVHLLNKAVVVIVPSQFCAVTFSACGVNVPIRVVPLGIDPAIFHWREFPEGDNAVFGTAGSLAGGEDRKGISEVVAAFRKAFPDEKNVRLRIKCHPDRTPGDWLDDERIDVVALHLSDEDLADWYASLTCFVSASKGEGFGLHQLEAMATGRPLISPRFGGLSEFARGDCGVILSHTLAPASPPYVGHWADVQERVLIAALKQVEHFKREFTDRGCQIAMHARDFDWHNAAANLITVLNEFGVLTDAPQEFHSL